MLSCPAGAPGAPPILLLPVLRGDPGRPVPLSAAARLPAPRGRTVLDPIKNF